MPDLGHVLRYMSLCRLARLYCGLLNRNHGEHNKHLPIMWPGAWRPVRSASCGAEIKRRQADCVAPSHMPPKDPSGVHEQTAGRLCWRSRRPKNTSRNRCVYQMAATQTAGFSCTNALINLLHTAGRVHIKSFDKAAVLHFACHVARHVNLVIDGNQIVARIIVHAQRLDLFLVDF